MIGTSGSAGCAFTAMMIPKTSHMKKLSRMKAKFIFTEIGRSVINDPFWHSPESAYSAN
jgi:hypothetical protein